MVLCHVCYGCRRTDGCSVCLSVCLYVIGVGGVCPTEWKEGPLVLLRTHCVRCVAHGPRQVSQLEVFILCSLE